jgi:histidine triad (HIT) family protein
VNSKPDCIFCRIVRGDAPAHVVCEDERTLVFMDLFPVANGHTLIIPKAHCDDLFDSDPEDMRAVMEVSRRVAHAIDRVLTPDGLGVYQLNRAPAGQTVFHYHMHLIPRLLGEGLQIHSRVLGDPARLAEVAKRLGDALAG